MGAVDFLVVTVMEMRRVSRPPAADSRPPAAAALDALARAGAAKGPLRILVATDGSPCGDRAVASVARRPWPAGSRIGVVTVAHTNVPLVPEPFLTGAAAHVQALEEDRQRAPGRVEAARNWLAAALGADVEGRVLEGDPADAIVGEAGAWPADLVVVGASGRGGFKRLALGSVSEAVVRRAPCSVEVVRCPDTA